MWKARDEFNYALSPRSHHQDRHRWSCRSLLGFDRDRERFCLKTNRQRGIHHHRAAMSIRLEHTGWNWSAVHRNQPEFVHFSFWQRIQIARHEDQSAAFARINRRNESSIIQPQIFRSSGQTPCSLREVRVSCNDGLARKLPASRHDSSTEVMRARVLHLRETAFAFPLPQD